MAQAQTDAPRRTMGFRIVHSWGRIFDGKILLLTLALILTLLPPLGL